MKVPLWRELLRSSVLHYVQELHWRRNSPCLVVIEFFQHQLFTALIIQLPVLTLVPFPTPPVSSIYTFPEQKHTDSIQKSVISICPLLLGTTWDADGWKSNWDSDRVILGGKMSGCSCVCVGNTTQYGKSKGGSPGECGSFTEPHSTTSAAEGIEKSVLLPIPGQPHPTVGKQPLPLPKSSDRTLKCPDRPSLVPFTPCRSSLAPPLTSDLACVADDNMKQLRETLWTL